MALFHRHRWMTLSTTPTIDPSQHGQLRHGTVVTETCGCGKTRTRHLAGAWSRHETLPGGRR